MLVYLFSATCAQLLLHGIMTQNVVHKLDKSIPDRNLNLLCMIGGIMASLSYCGDLLVQSKLASMLIRAAMFTVNEFRLSEKAQKKLHYLDVLLTFMVIMTGIFAGATKAIYFDKLSFSKDNTKVDDTSTDLYHIAVVILACVTGLFTLIFFVSLITIRCAVSEKHKSKDEKKMM